MSAPPEPQFDPKLIRLIRSGAEAERTLLRSLMAWAVSFAAERWAISKTDAPTLARKALRATVNAIRSGTNWQPDLARQMLQDQAYVYLLRHRGGVKSPTEQFKACAERYVRKCLIGWNGGHTLTPQQEAVCEDSLNVFTDKLIDPQFTLTSSLATFLIGIVKLKIYKAVRFHEQGVLPSMRPVNASRAPDASLLVPADSIRFYQRAHNLITAALGQLSASCQTIIVTHYGLDPERIQPIDDLPEKLSEAEFQARFDVAVSSSLADISLKELADKLNISPKKISARHLSCVDTLVKAVVTGLLAGPDIPDNLQEALQTRLARAHERQRNTR